MNFKKIVDTSFKKDKKKHGKQRRSKKTIALSHIFKIP